MHGRVSAADFQRNIGRYQDLALRQPVGRDAQWRRELRADLDRGNRRLKHREREVLGIEDFTDADAEAVRRAEAPAESASFDHELEP